MSEHEAKIDEAKIDDEKTVRLDLTELQFRAVVELVCKGKNDTLSYDPGTQAVLDDGSLLVSLLHQGEKQNAAS